MGLSLLQLEEEVRAHVLRMWPGLCYVSLPEKVDGSSTYQVWECSYKWPYPLVDNTFWFLWMLCFDFSYCKPLFFSPAGIKKNPLFLQAEFTGMKQIKFDDSNWPHVSFGQQPSVLLTSSWPSSVQLGVCTSGHSIGSHWMLMESSSHTQFLQSLVHLSPGWIREKCV